jgi:hypothetical protein
MTAGTGKPSQTHVDAAAATHAEHGHVIAVLKWLGLGAIAGIAVTSGVSLLANYRGSATVGSATSRAISMTAVTAQRHNAAPRESPQRQSAVGSVQPQGSAFT